MINNDTNTNPIYEYTPTNHHYLEKKKYLLKVSNTIKIFIPSNLLFVAFTITSRVVYVSRPCKRFDTNVT